MLESRSKHHEQGQDKYVGPLVAYEMTTRDYIVRPDATAAAFTLTLPPVAECKGRFYSIVAQYATETNTITVADQDDSEGWEGDIIFTAKGHGQLLYSDGRKWCLRTFADIEIAANPRGMYARSSGIAGEVVAGRFRAEGKKLTTTGAPAAYGVHAQGIAYASLFTSVVNALYAEAIAKTGSSTETMLRGAMIAADSEGTPTLIAGMIGCHVRVKTSVAPAGIYTVLKLESEKFGTGMPVDSFIDIRTTTWAAGNTIATYVVNMEELVGTVTSIFNLGAVTATNLIEVDADGDGAVTLGNATYSTAQGYFTVMVNATPYRVAFYDAAD